jgi:hypothetical protein
MATVPSIAMIPSGYKASKLYSVLPTNGDGDLDFSRGSVATRVNKDGLIEPSLPNVPRLDYTDGGCPSLLVEPQSTNIFTYSEDFSDASWVKLQATITADATASPTGIVHASKLVEDNSVNTHFIRTTNNYDGSSTYSISIFAKKGERNVLKIDTASSSGIAVGAFFNLNNGTVGTIEAGTAKIEEFSDGWYRCTVTGISSASLSVPMQFFVCLDDETTSYQGDGTSGIYIWGAQLEELPYATSYIPNNGTTAGVTRVAETVSKTGLENYINSSEGVLYAEISALADDGTERYWVLTDGLSQDYIMIGYSSNNNEIIGQIRNNNTIQQNFVFNLTDATDYCKLAVKWTNDTFYFYVNGVLIDNGSIVPITGLSNLKQGRDNGSLPFYGKIKDLRVYNVALSDAELAELTS